MRSGSKGAAIPHSERIVIGDSVALHEPDLATTENDPPISHQSGVSNRQEYNLALVNLRGNKGAQLDSISGFVGADGDHATQDGPSLGYSPREHHFSSAPRAAAPDEQGINPATVNRLLLTFCRSSS